MTTTGSGLNSPQYDISQLKSAGENVFISKNVEIRRPQMVSVGHNVDIDSGAYITTQAEIGDHVHIAAYVTVIGGKPGLLKMGNFTNIAVGGRIICVSDTFLGDGLIGAQYIPDEFRKLKIAPVVFENFVNVGANVVIMPGVTLREGSVVGAGSVVTKDTEPWTIYAGSPARPIKKRPKETMLKYAEKLGYPGGNKTLNI
ncbi:acyltransferase [Candidatus Giovannonibacteria bacterium]|nr:acyltransferase [Candidatus Giovannonibacteria bacterium]